MKRGPALPVSACMGPACCVGKDHRTVWGHAKLQHSQFCLRHLLQHPWRLLLFTLRFLHSLSDITFGSSSAELDVLLLIFNAPDTRDGYFMGNMQHETSAQPGNVNYPTKVKLQQYLKTRTEL